MILILKSSRRSSKKMIGPLTLAQRVDDATLRVCFAVIGCILSFY